MSDRAYARSVRILSSVVAVAFLLGFITGLSLYRLIVISKETKAIQKETESIRKEIRAMTNGL